MARDVILPVCRLSDCRVVDIIEKASRKDSDERAGFIQREINDLPFKEAVLLQEAPWPEAWPEPPIKLEKPAGEIAELPRCKCCPFAVSRSNYPRCVRPKRGRSQNARRARRHWPGDSGL